jgi:hypothetical protein
VHHTVSDNPRANIGNARIQGMGKDLNLVGYRFNWVTSIFYIVYMLVEGMFAASEYLWQFKQANMNHSAV